MTFVPKFLCVLSVGAIAGAVTAQDIPNDKTPKVGAIAAEVAPESPPQLVAGSLYQLPGKLIDDRGATISLDVFRGHPTLIAMFYASCPFVCPTLIANIQIIEGKLADRPREELRVLLVSFDPGRDSPAALQALRERHHVSDHWRFASASEDTLRQLAALLDVQYRQLPGGEFSHTAKITLLDRQGRIQTQIEGLNQPPTGIIEALEGDNPP